jgi:hypothetical protein
MAAQRDKERYYLLSTVVDDFIDDFDLSHGFWMKALKWGQRAVREMRLGIYQEPKTVLLDVTERRTVVLPDGFVDWCIVSVKRGQYAITLAVNDDLATHPRTSTSSYVGGLLSQSKPNGLNFDQYGGYTLLNNNGATLASYGGGLPSKGHFKYVDRGECKELLMDYDYNFSQVYVEYITDGLDPCEETVIHPYEYKYIMAFMEHMYEKRNNPKATRSSIDEAGRDLFFAERELRGRYNDITPRDMLTMSRAEARLTTKL